MVNIEAAIQKTLIHEGGYVNDPDDAGGATKYGITQADMPGRNIADITTDDAIAYYKEHYVKPLYLQIEDQLVAEKIFDMGVLFGVGEAIKLLQIALQPTFSSVTVDGQFGPNTLNAVNQVEPASLLSVYKTALVAYTLRIAVAKPQNKKFVAGWGNRINS